MDTGSTDHIVTDKGQFSSYKESKELSVRCPNGNNTQVHGVGDVPLSMVDASGAKVNVVLRDVLHVPEYDVNLLSVEWATSHDATFKFEQNKACMTLSKGIKVNLQRDGRLYKLPLERNPMTFSNKDSQLWHNPFGHFNNEDLQRTLGKKIPQDEFCKVCPLGKLSTSPIAKDRKDKATEPSERVFSDVMGPFQTKSLNGFQYAVTFVCDYSKHCVVKFMKNKSEVLDKFKEYVADTKKPQILRSDNGTEYTSQAMKDFCVEKSTRQEFTVPETPQQNGVAERMNRTLVDMTRCLLIQSKLSKHY